MSVDSADHHVQNGSTDTWHDFKMTGSVEARNALITDYLHIVKFQAERVHATMPEEVEFDDLHSAGVFGLMDAIEAFDLSRGVKFETYCVQRIRGAIMDELRRMDHAPRLVRGRNKRVQEIRSALRQVLHHEPTDEETVQALDAGGNKPVVMQDGSFVRGKTSLQQKVFETDSQRDVTEGHMIVDKRAPSPSAREEHADFYREMYKGLNQQERLILILYYREKLTMKQIGGQLELSESRISQMHSAIVERLKRKNGVKANAAALEQDDSFWDGVAIQLKDALATPDATLASPQSDPDLQGTGEALLAP